MEEEEKEKSDEKKIITDKGVSQTTGTARKDINKVPPTTRLTAASVTVVSDRPPAPLKLHLSLCD